MNEIKTVFSACKCNECEKVEVYHRAGCSCWDMERLVGVSDYNPSMVFGFLLSDNKGFVSNKELLDQIKNGYKAFDPDGEEITLDMFNKT